MAKAQRPKGPRYYDVSEGADQTMQRHRSEAGMEFGKSHSVMGLLPIGAVHATEKPDESRVRSMRQKMRAGHAFPPIIVNDNFGVIDGHHRLEAAEREGHTHIPAVMYGDHDYVYHDMRIPKSVIDSAQSYKQERLATLRKSGDETDATACPEGECCPHCGARLERDQRSGKCNRCGKDWEEMKKGQDGHSYSCALFALPPQIAETIRRFAKAQIPDADLAEDGREENPHITLKYGLHTQDGAEVVAAMKGCGPVRVCFGALETFPGEDYDVVYAPVESAGLMEMNKRISAKLEHTDTHPEYRPHATLAYVKAGQGEKYAGSEVLMDLCTTLRHLEFSNKAKQVTRIPLEDDMKKALTLRLIVPKLLLPCQIPPNAAPTLRFTLGKSTFDESRHPRQPKGTHQGKYRGGEFAPAGGGGAPPTDIRHASLKFELKADVGRLWKMETEKTYSSKNYPVLMVRESIQNAVDAIRRAEASGEIPKGSGRIDIHLNDRTHSISVRDNGIGMSAEDLQSKFLTLGATGKAGDPTQTGGFGMAKAIILGASKTFDWSIQTRDNSLTSAQIGEEVHEEEIKQPFRQGTTITVIDIDNWNHGDRGYYDNGSGTTERLVRETMAASVPEKGDIKFVLDDFGVPPLYKGRRATELSAISGFWGSGNDVSVKAYRRDGPDYSRITVRLNGLFQWAENVGQSNNLKPKDVVIDVTTTNRPADDGYPFTAGRDGFKWGPARDRMNELTNYLNQETQSAAREQKWEDTYVRRPKEAQESRPGVDRDDDVVANIQSAVQKIAERGGPVTREEISTGLGGGPSLGSGGSASLSQGGSHFMGNAGETVGRSHESDEGVVQGALDLLGRLGPILADNPYTTADMPWKVSRNRETFGRKKFDLVENLPLLTAWDAITHLTAKEYGMARIDPANFGSGFVLDPETRAMANSDNYNSQWDQQTQGKYAMLEPNNANAALKRAREKKSTWYMTNYLYALACHEIAHLPDMQGGHNESFTVRREDIALETGHLLPVFNAIVEACFPANRRDIKSAKSGDTAYTGVLDAAKQRAAAYHARQRTLKTVAKEFGVTVDYAKKAIPEWIQKDSDSTEEYRADYMRRRLREKTERLERD